MPNVKKVLMAAAGAGGGGKTLWAWGRNRYGGLGLNNTTDYSSPVQIGAKGDWQRASVAGDGHSLFIKPDGTMWSCGRNDDGQLGLGDTTDRSSPVQIGALTTWSFINTIDCGLSNQHRGRSAAIKTDGSLWMWGDNTDGSLGLGDTTDRSSPTQVGALTTWKKLVMGRDFSLALKTDGTIWSWGSNLSGQLGQNTSVGSNVSSPVQIGSLTTWIDVGAAGNGNVGAARSDSKMYCWGNNYYGNLGNNERGGAGGAPNRSSPVLVVGGHNFTSIAASYQGWVCVTDTNTMFSWGRNIGGVLGQGTSTLSVSSPVQIGSLTTWASWNAKDDAGNFVETVGNTNSSSNGFETMSTVKTKTDGTLWVWGVNGYGQLGLGNTTALSSPVQLGSSTSWVAGYGGFVSGWAFEE